MRQLSRALSVSKQFNRTILDSAELRRLIFLDSNQASEFLAMVKGADERCYKVKDEWQPVILREPIVAHETSRRPTRKIVQPHPILLRDYRPRLIIDVSLRNFNTVKTVPPSALLTQPPLTEVTIEHWGHTTKIRARGGVTFGAVLTAVEEIRTAVNHLIVRSPRFAGYQYGILNQLALTISGNSNEAIFTTADRVKIARRALKKAEEYAVLDAFSAKFLE